jgi:hypothetical protein
VNRYSGVSGQFLFCSLAHYGNGGRGDKLGRRSGGRVVCAHYRTDDALSAALPAPRLRCYRLRYPGIRLSSRQELIGLPGFEHIHGVPTSIYRWVQSQGRGLRIYSAGLRPLGLYGPELDNRVFYDLHSAMYYEDGDYGRRRLEAIRQDFDPDLIILAVDPHEYSPRRDKPLTDWLRTQPCVIEVFSDAVASAFRRIDGCNEPLNGSVRLLLPLRMGG